MIKKEKYQLNNIIKDRNEPCTLIQVLEIVSKIRKCNIIDLSEQIYQNTIRLFPLINENNKLG